MKTWCSTRSTRAGLHQTSEFGRPAALLSDGCSVDDMGWSFDYQSFGCSGKQVHEGLRLRAQNYRLLSLTSCLPNMPEMGLNGLALGNDCRKKLEQVSYDQVHFQSGRGH